MQERERLGSRLGFIMLSAGCAIGCGNVWKFPWMCGQNGGGSFMLLYILCLLVLGLPVMVMEFAVGRAAQASPIYMYQRLEKPGQRWGLFGVISLIGNIALMAFYTVVTGWILYYFVKFLTGSNADFGFAQMIADPKVNVTYLFVVVVAAFVLLSFNLQGGLERVTKYMMSALLVLMLVLAVHSLPLPGAAEGLKFYLVPDFAAMAEIGIGNVIFGALSQAFFTLSIGAGSMTIFGSYLGKDRSLLGESLHITILDTFVALMAGLIIIPACFAFGVEPGAGPGLVFITLPNVFNQMTGGKIWGALFFLFMSFASLSTVIAVFENIISYSMDRKGWSRGKAVIVNMVAMILLSLPAVFGFNILSGIQPLGAGTNIMDLEDFIVSNNILPLGSVVFVMFCVSKYGWGWKNFIKEADTGEGLKFPANVQKYMLYVIPAIVVVIYLKGYYDMFSPKGPVVLTVWMIVSLLVLGLVGWIIFGKNKTK